MAKFTVHNHTQFPETVEYEHGKKDVGCSTVSSVVFVPVSLKRSC